MQLDTSPNLSLESLTHLLEKNITVHFECRALLSECPTQVTSASLEKCMFLRWLPHSSGFTYEDPIHEHLTMWSHVPQACCNWQQLFWSLSYSLLKHDSNHLLHISRDMPIILCFFFFLFLTMALISCFFFGKSCFYPCIHMLGMTFSFELSMAILYGQAY